MSGDHIHAYHEREGGREALCMWVNGMNSDLLVENAPLFLNCVPYYIVEDVA